MRIVRIQSRICVGGPALHSILLSQGLSYQSGSRFDTTLIGGALEPGETSMLDFARDRGVEVCTLPEMRRPVHPIRDVAAIGRMVGLLKKLRPQIVHTHTAKAGAVGRIAARLAGVPLVVHTFHGHVFEGYFSKRKTSTFIQVERALARNTNRIVAISSKQRDDLVHKYRIAPESKVRVVPLGLDLNTFRLIKSRNGKCGVLRRELGIKSESSIAVAVGRLVPIKRFDLLIQAFRTLLPSRHHLVIVGDGECRPQLEKLSRDLPNVHLIGLRRDLAEIYFDADLVVLSSDNEGTPVALIEAVTSGVPVVATDVGGVRDIYRDGMGSIVPRGDVQQLGRAIKEHLDQPYSLLGLHRDDVLSRYGHRRLLSDIETLYDEILQENKRNPVKHFTQILRGS